MPRFLDTNILLQHLAREDERKAIGCRELPFRLQQGEEVAVTTDLVVFEAVHVLQSPRHYGLSPDQVRQLLEPLIHLTG